MQPNWKRTSGLALLLFVLGGGAYWLEYSHRPKTEKEEAAQKKPFPLDGKSVNEAVLVYGKDRSFSFRCRDAAAKKCKPGDDAKWDLSVPMATSSDHGNVNSLISSLGMIEVEETISLKEEPAAKRAELMKEYGLSPEDRAKPDASRIEVTTDDGKKRTLRLGGNHPIGGKIFSIIETDGKADEETVWLLPSHARTNLEHDLTYWRDKRLFTAELSTLSAFSIQGKESFNGEKKDTTWILRKSGGKEEFQGDTEAIEVLLSSLAFLNAKAFPDVKEAQAAKKSIHAEFVSGKETFAVDLFEKVGEAPPAPKGQKGGPAPRRVFVKVVGRTELYEVDPSALTRIGKPMSDLRLSRLVPSLERFNMKSIRFSGKGLPEGTLELLNKDSKWFFGPDSKEEADGEKVQRFLDDLTGPRIRGFGTLTAAGGDPTSGIELLTGDDKGPERRKIRFWKSEKKLFARDLLSKREEAYELDSALGTSLPWIKDHFRKK